MSIESVMPSNYLILCHPLFLLPPNLPASGSFAMSQFLGRLIRSPESPRRKKGSEALEVEIGVWNSQGGGKDKYLFFFFFPLYIP